MVLKNVIVVFIYGWNFFQILLLTIFKYKYGNGCYHLEKHIANTKCHESSWRRFKKKAKWVHHWNSWPPSSGKWFKKESINLLQCKHTFKHLNSFFIRCISTAVNYYPYKKRSKTVGPKFVSEINASLSNKMKRIST